MCSSCLTPCSTQDWINSLLALLHHKITSTSTFVPNHTSQPQTNLNETFQNPHHIGQTSNFTSNYTPHFHPLSPNNHIHILTEKERFREDINQIHDLCDLLAIHLAQHNKGQPRSSILTLLKLLTSPAQLESS